MQYLNDFVRNNVMEVAQQFDHGVLTVEHACLAMLGEPTILHMMTGMGVDTDGLYRALDSFLVSCKTETTFQRDEIAPDDLFRHVIARTVGRAVGTITMANATVIDLFLSILSLAPETCASAHILNACGITLENTSRYLSELPIVAPPVDKPKEKKDDKESKDATPAAAENKSPFKNLAEAEEYLLKFSTNLNNEALAGNIDPLIGREEEVSKTIQVLMRRRKNNPILIGEAGVGKTSIAEGLALRIVNNKVPKAFSSKIIYSLDVGSLVAGTRYRGDFEERMRNLVTALSMLPRAIIFIDEIHLIVDGGKVSSAPMDASNLLKPALAKGQIRCIGATTYDDFRKTMERDKALVRRFKKIRIEAPTPEQAKLIILGLRPSYEQFHDVTYTVGAVNAAVDLVTKYFRDAILPDRAIDLIDDAGARQRLAKKRKTVIDKADIEHEVALITAIPLSNIQASESQSIMRLAQSIKGSVFGQDGAVDSVTDVIKIARAGLRPTNKPEAMFLFVGPTGVGKTELARALARELNVKLIKYDMSEYMESSSVARLIGSPPGYVGHGEGSGSGMLIKDIEENPRCVLLLDEVEKAHSDVFNILLQIMDDARLTSGTGKVADFRNVIIIMTSNAGAAQMSKQAIGLRKSEYATFQHSEIALKKFFAPEFINRLDGVVPFRALPIMQLEKVAEKFLDEVGVSLLERGISFQYTPEVATWVVAKGYDEKMGARPIGRTIDHCVRLPLANLVLSQDAKEGWVISIKLVDGELSMDIQPPPLKELEVA